MSEINASNFKKEHDDLAPDIVGVTELTSPYFFVPPSGTTAERPEECEPGTLRFNTDIGSLEVFRGDGIGWEIIQRRESQYLGGGTGSNTGTGVRGIVAGGNTPTTQDKIEYVTISTFGNIQDFGDLLSANTAIAGLASNTRGIFQGGGNPNTNVIQFITIASLGNAADFGDLSGDAAFGECGYGNGVRGVLHSGSGTNPYTISDLTFINFATTGNSSDYGELTATKQPATSFSNKTRGLHCASSSPANSTQIDASNIQTGGKAVDFGDYQAASMLSAAMGTSNDHGGL